jgi:hypothetical protein
MAVQQPASSAPTRNRLSAWAGGLAIPIGLVLAYFAWAFPNPTIRVALLALIVICLVALIVVSVGGLRDAVANQHLTGLHWLLLIGTLLMAVGFGSIGALSLPTQTQPSGSFANLPFSAQLDSAMWQAFVEQRWEAAAASAELLIVTFGGEAEKQHAALIITKEPAPYIGSGTAILPEQRLAIFKKGEMNSVATAYLVLRHARAAQQRYDEARTAYENAARFPYARTYDPKTDQFWSVAEEATRYMLALPMP